MDKFIESRPQRLCLMCGKCCRVATTPIPYSELLELVNSGDESAKDFLNIFEPYSSLEAARSVSAETVDNILARMKSENSDISNVTFYRCKHIADNNLCKIYGNRPLLCDRFPTSPWAVIPPGCGFEGWMFMKREETKKIIRHQKEALVEFEAMLNTEINQEKREKLQQAISKINNIVDLYTKYGAKDW